MSKEQIKNIIDNNSQRGANVGKGIRARCRKKLHANGCFDCDKVITVQRFSAYEPPKPHSC
jgi:hypothetical protein